MGLAKILALTAAHAASWETVVQLAEHEQRNAAFTRAQGMTLASGKPLLVVGTPRSRRLAQILGPAHQCGDVCIDLDPLVERQCGTGVMADVREIPFPDHHFGAAVCSHVLEHMPDLESFHQAVGELHRVADHVEVVCPHRASLMAWVTVGHRLFVTQHGDGVVEGYDRHTGESLVLIPS